MTFHSYFFEGGCNVEFSPAIAPQIFTSVVDQVMLEATFQPAGMIDEAGLHQLYSSDARAFIVR